MATNVTPEYLNAEKEYFNAKTLPERMEGLRKMLQACPKHKGAEKLQKQIKERISKLKDYIEKEKQAKKSRQSLSIKKEGAAQIVLVGTTNTGKSTLLHQLTGAHVAIAPYPFTTKKPEVGIMDYKGVKLQIIEIPAITPDFPRTEMGPTYLSLIRQADFMILLFNNPKEKHILDTELHDIFLGRLVYNHQENLADLIWQRLPLIKVYTKQPGKEKDYPPIAFHKGATVKDIAARVHKDFVKRFRFARIFGPSAKFVGQTVGLNHVLADEDAVELHLN